MSPEAIDPEDRSYSPASDVWALGILCHEIFTDGKTPYEGWPLMKLIKFLCIDRGRPELPPEAPPEWAAIIRECWHFDPGDRPTSAQLVRRFTALYDREGRDSEG